VDYQTGSQDCEYNYQLYGFCTGLTGTTTSSQVTNECIEQYGMTICDECLLNGQCKFNVYDALGIRTSIREK